MFIHPEQIEYFAFQASQVDVLCMDPYRGRKTIHNNRDVKCFDVRRMENIWGCFSYQLFPQNFSLVLFSEPSARTQWIVNKWKKGRKTTKMMNRKVLKAKWPLCKRIFRIFFLFPFSHGSKIFFFLHEFLDPPVFPSPSGHEFIIISFWYFKQWKSNINLIKITNVFLISSAFFPFLPLNNGEISTNNKIVKSNKERTATK